MCGFLKLALARVFETSIIQGKKIILPLIHHFVIIPDDFSDSIIVKLINISLSTK